MKYCYEILIRMPGEEQKSIKEVTGGIITFQFVCPIVIGEILLYGSNAVRITQIARYCEEVGDPAACNFSWTDNQNKSDDTDLHYLHFAAEGILLSEDDCFEPYG